MINTAEVFLWGTRIGIIHQDDDKPYISFEYDNEFINSGIEVAPIKMKLSSQVYDFPDLVGDAFHGAPGLIADSLPDKFGNKVIERWLLEQGRSINDFNTIKVQLIALHLIELSDKKHSSTDTNTYWRLTKYGKRQMMKLYRGAWYGGFGI